MRPVYGIQRRLAETGTVDAAGFLVENREEPPWDVVAFDDSLEIDLVKTAWRNACRGLDALDVRIRKIRDVFYQDRPGVPPPAFEVTSVNNALEFGSISQEVANQLSELLTTSRCRPDQSTALLRVVVGNDATLLVFVIDHTVTDGTSFSLLQRKFASIYRDLYDGREPRANSLESFDGFLDEQPSKSAQKAVLKQWQDLVRDFPAPGPAIQVGGDDSRQSTDYTISSERFFELPPVVSTWVRSIRMAAGASDAEVWIAAGAVTASMASAGPQSCILIDDGRVGPNDRMVFGPLMSMKLSIPGTSTDSVISQIELNRSLPPVQDQLLRTAGMLTPRKFEVSHKPVPPVMRLSETIVGHSLVGREIEKIKPSECAPYQAYCPVSFGLYPRHEGGCNILVKSDSSVVPDPGVLVDLYCQTVQQEFEKLM